MHKNPQQDTTDLDDAFRNKNRTCQHPERLILGKPHPDRAKQFMPFAALRGYSELVEEKG